MSDSAVSNRYEPTEAEPQIVERWEQAGVFEQSSASQPATAKGSFSIAIPPPNVTGALHMGHALNGSIQDALIRLNRMRGKNVHWTFGTDHAGIATQTKVEQQLIEEGTTRQQIGRDAFLDKTHQWRDQYGGTIVKQFRRLGITPNFAGERFTMDDAYASAVSKVFVELYEQGLIYRDKYLVNWDPGSQSAISDLEVEDREVTDAIYEIAYQVVDPEGSTFGEIIVATVRPETLIADVAVAVNPTDERYSSFVGKTAVLPLTGRQIPIIADDYVKVDFGTGALKITPGHDPNDFEIGQRHKLPSLNCISEDGRITGDFLPAVEGLAVAEARDQIVKMLDAAGDLRGQEEYVHTVPFSHRSGERIEPLISLQWFMNMSELAAPAIEAVTSGKVKIHPASQEKRYIDWLSEIKPWCLSRQLWWGHQIPVWYRFENAGDEVPAETYCGIEAPAGEGWQRDEDVLDTWFSSALWPMVTLGWPNSTAELEEFYPTSVLSTARDILFLWVARMVMMGQRFAGDIPFRDVYIHSVIQAPDGRRMSKSLGTGVDPLDLINGGSRPPVFAKKKGQDAGEFPAYGADAVRFGLLAMASTQDVRFSEEKVLQGKQLVTKLANAVRFVTSDSGKASQDQTFDPASCQNLEDLWIVSQTERAAQEISGLIDAFDFSKAALHAYDFVFGTLCDWYLEFTKPRKNAGDPTLQPVLAYVLRRTLQIVHPILPFVTEDCWQQLALEGLCCTSQLDEPRDSLLNPHAEQEVAKIIEAVSAVRGWRNAANVPPGPILQATLKLDGVSEGGCQLIGQLARLSLVNEETDAVTISTASGTIQLLASEHVDPQADRDRREKRRSELSAEIQRISARLADDSFALRAPEQVVQGARDQLQQAQDELATL